MQKELVNNQAVENDDFDNVLKTTSEPITNESDRSKTESDTNTASGIPENAQSTEQITSEFEELIKGPYKEAFSAKVQSIINKRFKEQKLSESKTNGNSASPSNSDLQAADSKAITDDALETLIKAGIDADTAYKVLHLDEMLNDSMRYGASVAAKQLADSIRIKGMRPKENGLNPQGGFTAHKGAAGLTPEKRRELAKKALMGEQIGF